MKKTILTTITLLSIVQGALATTVQEADPTKVLVITRNDGTVLVVQPREADYRFVIDRTSLEITQADHASDNQSLLSKIFGGRRGGKCHKRH